ncbi:MAG: hypothetical protein NC117_01195 [Pseudoflavonifractor sp.]|nr:hypothetical protein [Pseudoflavonifractor sp.]
MKRPTLLLIAFLTIITASADKYVHYHMSDGSFHGFYASSNPTVLHDNGGQTSSISLNGNVHDMQVGEIERIVIEDANLSDDFDGDYRIYEKSCPQGIFKKIIIDNRACLLASKNGDFGANDTILAASAYNNERLLLYTDDLGQAKKFFTTRSLYSHIRMVDGPEDLVELTEDGATIDHSDLLPLRDTHLTAKDAAAVSFDPVRLHEVIQNIQGIIDDPLSGIKNLVQNYTDLGKNPELHNQFLVVDGIILARDFASFAASTASVLGTSGFSWGEFISDLESLAGSTDDLLNDMFPDSKQMEKYRDFYRTKYNIEITATTPSDITSTSANLKGSFTSTAGINGTIKLKFHKLLDDEPWSELTPSIEMVSSQSFTLSYPIDKLLPHTDYLYYIVYECVVDGLNLTFSSDAIDFTTDREDIPDPTPRLDNITCKKDCVTYGKYKDSCNPHIDIDIRVSSLDPSQITDIGIGYDTDIDLSYGTPWPGYTGITYDTWQENWQDVDGILNTPFTVDGNNINLSFIIDFARCNLYYTMTGDGDIHVTIPLVIRYGQRDGKTTYDHISVSRTMRPSHNIDKVDILESQPFGSVNQSTGKYDFLGKISYSGSVSDLIWYARTLYNQLNHSELYYLLGGNIIDKDNTATDGEFTRELYITGFNVVREVIKEDYVWVGSQSTPQHYFDVTYMTGPVAGFSWSPGRYVYRDVAIPSFDTVHLILQGKAYASTQFVPNYQHFHGDRTIIDAKVLPE